VTPTLLPTANLFPLSPANPPVYAVTVKAGDGSEVSLACPKATRSLILLMDQHAVNAGAAAHWGGPSGFTEIMSAIHGILFREKKAKWFENYNFVNDAGHCENCVYAIRALYNYGNIDFEKLKTFRGLDSPLTGHGEAHLNPQNVLISNGPLGSGLPQAQGLAIADKILANGRVTICTISDGAAMEGEAKEAFAAIPGLAAKGRLNPFVMVVSDNNTKLSGRIDEDSFSMERTFQSFSQLGWKVIVVPNGNNLSDVFLALETAVTTAKKNPGQPVCLWMKTIKGQGLLSTVKDSSGGHGYPLKKFDPQIVSLIEEIWSKQVPAQFSKWALSLLEKPTSSSSSPTSPAKTEKVQTGIARAMIRAASEGLPVFSISADLAGSTGVRSFQKQFPAMSLDVGIAEANMISVAAGLSRTGFIPVVDTFAAFGITKGNLPLVMANLSLAPVMAIFSHTGFQDAADGASHQSTHYMGAIASIPQTQLVVCSSSKEAEEYLYLAITRFSEARRAGKTPDSVIFFLGRENYPATTKEDLPYNWGDAQILEHGDDVTIVACGPMVFEALNAHKILLDMNVRATVINNPFVNHPDVKTISHSLKRTNGKLITIEDHQLIGGMGALLCHQLALKKIPFRMKGMGIPGVFGRSAHTSDDLYEKYHLTAKSIAECYFDLA
jgi:transketolase